MNFVVRWDAAARQFPDRTALVDDAQVLTYRDLRQKAAGVAAYLREAGLEPGDRVAAVLPNSAAYVVLAYATWWNGAIFTPVNVRLAPQELEFVLRDAAPRFVAVPGPGGVRLAAVRSEEAYRSLATAPDQVEGVAFDAIAPLPVGQEPPVAARRDTDEALLMYTSGTTGRPKGVRQTHRNNLAACDMVIDTWALTAADCFLLTVPMFHVGGLQCSTLPALAAGASVVILPKWSPTAWAAMVRQWRATLTGLVSTMMVDVVNHAEAPEIAQGDFRSLRLVAMGGAPTPPAVAEAFERIVKAPLIELYGQTEQTGLTVTYRAGEPRRVGSMGRVQAQVAEAMVLASDGTPIPPGQDRVGELCIRGETVTPGYWNNPDATRDRLVDGWLRTGDMVRQDADGYLYYVERRDDMIISGGENIFPTEVEAALSRCPAVREVAVFGTPHERWGQTVTAAVVPQGSDVTEETILRFLEEDGRLARYKWPRRFLWLSELPKTGSGKVNKAALKTLYA
jgi:long-chain acyl-CoA synthetase